MTSSDKDYEIINGIKVSKDMPEEQKEALRNEEHSPDDPELTEALGNLGNPKKVKARVTMMIDEDILNQIKEDAKEQGKRYQTFLNQKLRKVFIEKEMPSNEGDQRFLAKAILSLSQTIQEQNRIISELEKNKAS